MWSILISITIDDFFTTNELQEYNSWEGEIRRKETHLLNRMGQKSTSSLTRDQEC